MNRNTTGFLFGAPLATAPAASTFPPAPAATPPFPHPERDPVSNTIVYMHTIEALPGCTVSCDEQRWQVYSNYGPLRPAPQKEELPNEPVPDYRNEIGSLLEDTTFADITFVVEGEEIKAHRSILSARSPTFKAMFTSGLSESAAGAVVKLNDNKTTFLSLLRYIYCDQVSIPDVDTAVELLGKAEEYFLLGLKKECEDVLVERYLTEDTAPCLLRIATTFRTPKLKKACTNFILRNTSSVNVTELEKDELVELLVSAWSLKAQGFSWPSATAAAPAPVNPFQLPTPTAGPPFPAPPTALPPPFGAAAGPFAPTFG